MPSKKGRKTKFKQGQEIMNKGRRGQVSSQDGKRGNSSHQHGLVGWPEVRGTLPADNTWRPPGRRDGP